MNKKYLKTDVSFFITFRSALSIHLPINTNLVVFDILMFVLNEYWLNRPLTVKRLFRSLHLSHTGFRHHFRMLVNDEWVSLSKMLAPEADQRLRFIRPSLKLIASVSEMKQILREFLENQKQ